MADRNAKGRTAHGQGAGASAHKVRLHGHRINTSKLEAWQAKQLISVYTATDASYVRLGKMYGISPVAARLIVKGVNHKYLYGQESTNARATDHD